MLFGPMVGMLSHAQIPVFSNAIPAGFPSPADDFIEGALDFNELLIRKPSATYCLRVSGHSMQGAGIHHGDYLIVDRSEKPVHGRVVVAALDGELTLKRLMVEQGKHFLFSENADFQPIEIKDGHDLVIFGCATYAIHSV